MYRMNPAGRMSGSRPRQQRPNAPYACPQPSQQEECREAPTLCKLEDLPLAMAYVPFQSWATPYTPERALCRGTMFPALDLPLGGQA